MTVREIDLLISNKDLSTRVGQLARNSLLVLRERWEPSIPPLRIEIGGSRSLAALDVSDVTKAVQDATARIAQLLLHQNKDMSRLSKEIRERAKLIPRGQSGNVLLFDFPAPVVVDEGETLPVGHIEHLSERAVRELVENLPESGDDQASLQNLPARRLAIRAAVNTLARAVKTSGDLKIELASHTGTPERSVLTVEQAREVPVLLSNEHDETETIQVEGVLDGMRTRRRLFYVIEQEDRGGAEYEGSIEPDQVARVQESLGKLVIARLRKTTRVRDDGSRTHAVFSLIDFSVPQTLI